MTRLHSFLVLTATVCLVVLPASADVVTTADGSRFVGTVEQIANGRLVIQTEIAGRLDIDASKVTSISMGRTVNIALKSGDTLVGTVVTSAADGSSVVRSGLGDIQFSPADITELWSAGTDSPRMVAVREKAKAQVEAATPKWTATLEGSITRTEGNTDTMEARGRFDVKRTSKSELLHLYILGEFAEQDNARTLNEYLGGIRYENNVTDRSFWYARTELEFDEFEDIDLRTTAAVGSGRYWIKEADRELKTVIGLGYRHESYSGGRTENNAVLDLGLNYRVDLAPWAQFTNSTVYSPDFMDTGNYRLTFDTALLIPFKNERLAWKMGVRNEYNSRPQPGFERLDNTYYTSIVMSLK